MVFKSDGPLEQLYFFPLSYSLHPAASILLLSAQNLWASSPNYSRIVQLTLDARLQMPRPEQYSTRFFFLFFFDLTSRIDPFVCQVLGDGSLESAVSKKLFLLLLNSALLRVATYQEVQNPQLLGTLYQQQMIGRNVLLFPFRFVPIFLGWNRNIFKLWEPL